MKQYGLAAQFSDLTARAKAAGTEMGGEKIKRRKRAEVPGGYQQFKDKKFKFTEMLWVLTYF